jgi:hypothetical protein
MASNPEQLEAGEHSHSGRLLLRMPKQLHAELAARSDREGVSLNQWIVAALSRAAAGEDEPAGVERRSRTVPRELRVALIVNAFVVAAAAAIAIALIVIAWN